MFAIIRFLERALHGRHPLGKDLQEKSEVK